MVGVRPSLAAAVVLCWLGALTAPRAQTAVAPPFALKSLDGTVTTLEAQHGKVVLLNFWATWCPTCRTEIPILMKLQAAYGPSRLTVLGVAMDDEGSRVVGPFIRGERFALNRATAPVNYPVLIGTDAVADAYHVESLPTTVIIDAGRHEVRRIETAIEFGDIDRSIQSLLAGKSGK